MASAKAMVRLTGVVVLLAFGLLAVPAVAGDATVTFRCCSYSPSTVRLQPTQTLTIAPEPGVAFDDHPLHYTDNIGNTLTGTTPADRTFPQDGIYQWYCSIHGHYDAGNNTVSGMSGRVIVTTNTPPTASFTASATDVPTGTEIHFDGTGSDDPDFNSGQTINYSWDLEGDGHDDPGQTSPTPSMVYTNTGTTPRQITVRLTVTDTNSDAVGPESGSRSLTITVEPPPSSGAGGGGGTDPGTGLPVPDTRPPVARIVRTKVERTRVRVTFTVDESGSVFAELRQGHRKSQVTRDFAAAGRYTITLRVPRKLRHRRVTLTLAITDDTGNGRTLKRSLKLR